MLLREWKGWLLTFNAFLYKFPNSVKLSEIFWWAYPKINTVPYLWMSWTYAPNCHVENIWMCIPQYIHILYSIQFKHNQLWVNDKLNYHTIRLIGFYLSLIYKVVSLCTIKAEYTYIYVKFSKSSGWGNKVK